MTDTVTVSRERLSRMVSAIDMLIPTLPGLNDKGRTWLRDEIIESTDALRAALDAEPAPVQEPVYAFRRKGMDDFCTCNKARFDELASKPHLFETAIFYTAQPRTAVKLSDSEIASDASRHWSEDGVDPIAFAHAIESAVWAKNGWAE